MQSARPSFWSRVSIPICIIKDDDIIRIDANRA